MEWEERWKSGNTPWDAGAPPPALVELVEGGELPPGNALVPGCGAGYDVLALASEQRQVTGLEVAPSAIRRFEELRSAAKVPPQHASVIPQDFFSFRPESPFDLVWDHTFLCAIGPAQRNAWAKQMQRLVSLDGELITLLFPVDDRPRDEGPPYLVEPEMVRRLLAPDFTAVHLAPVTRSHPKRQGKEWLGRWRKQR